MSHILQHVEQLQTEAADTVIIQGFQSLIVSCMQAGSTSAGRWLQQHRKQLLLPTKVALYTLASKNNECATTVLQALAEDELKASPDICVPTTPPSRQIVPVNLVNYYIDTAKSYSCRSLRLIKCKEIVEDNKEWYFFLKEAIQQLRDIEWRTYDGATDETLTDSHRVQRKINQLIDVAHVDNRHLINELDLLRQSEYPTAKQHYDTIIRGFAVNMHLFNIIEIALQQHQYLLVRNLLCSIGKYKNQSLNLAIKNCIEHILRTNDITAMAMLANTISSHCTSLLTASRIMYYRHPNNAECALAYYTRLKHIGRYAIDKTVREEIYRLVKIGHTQKNDEASYQYLCIMTFAINGIIAAFTSPEMLLTLRDISRPDSLKKRIFTFLLAHEEYVMENKACYLVIANCYQEGLGCDANPDKALIYRKIAAQLGNTEAYDACFPDQQGPQQLLRKARYGYRAAVTKLKYLAEADNPEAIICLAKCHLNGYGIRPDTEKEADDPEEYQHRFTKRELTRTDDGTDQYMKLNLSRFFLMAIGASNRTYKLLHREDESTGYYDNYAAIDFADLTREYIDSLSRDEHKKQWQRILDDSDWSLHYTKKNSSILNSDNSLLQRLANGHLINVNANWSSWDSGHSYQLVFFQYQNQIYMAKSNRGERRSQDKPGTTFYHVGNLDSLQTKGALMLMIKKCKERSYCEGMESNIANTLGHDLQLTAVEKGHIDQSNQKGGTCALATIQNLYKTHLAIHHILAQPDFIEAKASDTEPAIMLTADKIIRAFKDSEPLYKAWRAVIRILSMRNLTAIANPSDSAFIQTDQHLTIMLQALDYVRDKRQRKNDRCFKQTHKQLLASCTPLLGFRSPYSSEQKKELRQAMRETHPSLCTIS
ncbi:MAG: tetratricopeptide repeat protein [Coxiellaceae bacterium]|nr:tetratricopeptide repeat protein [Coxiellaceae bacterium]